MEKGENVEAGFEINQFEKNDPFEKYFLPNTAYSFNLLQFLPIHFLALIDP
jgi:hypothetical protein